MLENGYVVMNLEEKLVEFLVHYALNTRNVCML